MSRIQLVNQSPPAVDKKTADKINSQVNPENDPRKKVNAASNVIGQKVTIASTDRDSAPQKLKTKLKTLYQEYRRYYQVFRVVLMLSMLV